MLYDFEQIEKFASLVSFCNLLASEVMFPLIFSVPRSLKVSDYENDSQQTAWILVSLWGKRKKKSKWTRRCKEEVWHIEGNYCQGTNNRLHIYWNINELPGKIYLNSSIYYHSRQQQKFCFSTFFQLTLFVDICHAFWFTQVAPMQFKVIVFFCSHWKALSICSPLPDKCIPVLILLNVFTTDLFFFTI